MFAFEILIMAPLAIQVVDDFFVSQVGSYAESPVHHRQAVRPWSTFWGRLQLSPEPELFSMFSLAIFMEPSETNEHGLQRFARFYEVEARWDIVTDVLLFRI